MAAVPHVSATAAAKHARADLGLAPQGGLKDIVALIEGTGHLPVTIDALPESLSGAFLRVRARPFILLNGTNHPTRQRFTLAHEFGHFRLGHGEVIDGPESFTSQVSTPDEVAANQFAAEFLLPLAAVHAWMEAHDNPTVDLAVAVRLAVDFGVSPHVARFRLAEAGCLTPRQKKDLDEGLQNNVHRQLILLLGLTEHQDTITEARSSLPRVPAQLRANAFRGYADGLLNVDRLSQLLRQDPQSVKADLARHGVVQSLKDEDPDW